MNPITKQTLYILAASLLISLGSCKKYLEEYNPAGRTDETYYTTKAGFGDLVKANYPNLRPIVNYGGLYFPGTDIFSSYNMNDAQALNLYNSSLNSAIGDVDGYWGQLYYAINVANTTLYWATQVQGEEASMLNTRVAEAKTLRAFYYFLLVETFGDVPLVLTRSTEPTLAYTRTAEKEVYDQLIKDLTESIAALPAANTDFGRVTKGAAQHLLAKVYLTRGYKSYGAGNADFGQAATLAEAVIAGPYSLKPKFADLFDPTITNFQVNPEVIFSVQYSNNAPTNGSGNALHQYFLWDTQIVPAIGRSSLYGKPNYVAAPTPYFFSLFDKVRDSRYSASFWNVIYAQTATAGFAVGDTVVYYPNVAFTAEQKAAKKYYVINPNEYRTSPFTAGVRSHPEIKKFRELNLPYGDNGGFRDTYVFRLAETYLIAAEAYLKAGNVSKALEKFNAIRTRAALPGTNPETGLTYAAEMQVNDLTVDTILEERARELVGEEFRWFELKRTGTLVTRTLQYNEEAKAANMLKPFHLLRPIPQSQIDLNRGTFPQNKDY